MVDTVAIRSLASQIISLVDAGNGGTPPAPAPTPAPSPTPAPAPTPSDQFPFGSINLSGYGPFNFDGAGHHFEVTGNGGVMLAIAPFIVPEGVAGKKSSIVVYGDPSPSGNVRLSLTKRPGDIANATVFVAGGTATIMMAFLDNAPPGSKWYLNIEFGIWLPWIPNPQPSIGKGVTALQGVRFQVPN